MFIIINENADWLTVSVPAGELVSHVMIYNYLITFISNYHSSSERSLFSILAVALSFTRVNFGFH